jgi:hemerythrin-like metal-binding protein
MTFLEWKESYNLGIKEIDNQHRGLFDLISKLSTTKYFEHDEKYFFATLNTLVKYAELHFATEERYMAQASYAQAEEHHQEHEKFLKEIMRLAEELEQKTPNLQSQILTFLHDWYLKHILGDDKNYVASLKAKGLA